MKRAFWIWVFLSVTVPLVGVTLAGGYFFHGQKTKARKESLKLGLKEDSLKLKKKLDGLIQALSKELEGIASERLFPENSFFSAVVLKTHPPDGDDTVFIPPPEVSVSPNSSASFFQGLATHLPEKLQGVRFYDIPVSDGRDQFLAFIVFSPGRFFSREEKNAALVAGFIRHDKMRQILPSFLDFSDGETREVFLLTSQGWLLFHPRNMLKTLPERMLPKRALDTQVNRFVRWEKKKKLNLAYILPDRDSHLFIAAKAPFKDRPFLLSSIDKNWLLVCFGAWVFILSALAFIFSPLLSAFFELKRAFFQYSRSGDLPFIVPSSPFLSFYPDIRRQVQEREDSFKTPPLDALQNKERSLSFKQALLSEYEKLNRKYPGFSLKQDLKANVFLWQFEPFMKRILSALLLNAIEAMGAQAKQTVTVTTRQQQGRFIFTIEDRGPGLTAEQSRRAFSLYHSTKSQLGAGLNLVTSLVTANKGSIKLLPRPGGGTVASVSLPDSCFLKTQRIKSIFSLVRDKSKDFKGKAAVSFFVPDNTKRSQGSGFIH